MKKIKILFMFSIYMMLNMNLGFGQDFKVLQIGDTIPEAFYKEVAKLGSAGKMFSESKGKLVLLDFWSTYCSTCLMSFPKMKSLQNEFEGEIQIFLVNDLEDSLKIEERMKLPSLENYKTDLPSIADAGIFKKLFPYKAVPYHVWFDGDGIVRLMGSALNTHQSKISTMLENKEVFILKGFNNSYSVDDKTSLHSIEGVFADDDNDSQFLFTGHNNDYTAENSLFFESIIDSTSGKVRDTYINNEVLEIYKRVFIEEITDYWNTIIYNGRHSNNGGFWRDYFILDVKDTLKVSSFHIPYVDRNEMQYIESRYCYEQIMPMNYTIEERRLFMLENLNEYFGKRLGVNGSFIEKEVKAFVLSTNEEKGFEKKMGSVTPLKSALYDKVFKFLSKYVNEEVIFMIDETGLSDLEGLSLPTDDNYTFEDIVLALKKYGISMDEEIRRIKFFKISDTEV